MVPAIISTLLLYHTSIARSVPIEQPVVEQVSEPEPPQTLFTNEELRDLVYASADKHGVNRAIMLATVKCEAKKRNIDGVIYYDAIAKSDYNERSYGLAQWNLDAKNKNLAGIAISHAEATTATTSLDLMAHYFATGKARLWSCYKKQLT